jgi:hypothetical protein
MREKEPHKIKNFLWANIFTMAGAIMAIANLWIFAKLQPVAVHIDQVATQVQALSSDLENHKISNTNGEQVLNTKMDLIQKSITGNDRSSLNSRLSRIEGKLGL